MKGSPPNELLVEDYLNAGAVAVARHDRAPHPKRNALRPHVHDPAKVYENAQGEQKGRGCVAFIKQETRLPRVALKKKGTKGAAIRHWCTKAM